MLEVKHGWTTDGASSGGLTPVEVQPGVAQSVLYCQFSTLATTNTFELQTAISSNGPWFTEGSTSISTALNGLAAIRLTGPYTWARPYLKTVSTGAYTFQLLGIT